MAFDIKEIRASLDQHSYLKAHSFDIQMNPPPILRNSRLNILNSVAAQEISADMSMIPDIIRVRAEESSLPGAMILTADNNRYGIGPSQKNPFNVLFTDTSLTFLADRFGILWAYFYLWKQSIFTWDKKASSTPSKNASVPRYTLQYRKTKDGDNYVTDMDVTAYDVVGMPRMKFKLIGAYPTMVPSTPVAWGANDQMLKLRVNFTFQRWEMQDITEESLAQRALPTTVEEWNRAGTSQIATDTPGTNFTTQ